jgi:hypothetical protein
MRWGKSESHISGKMHYIAQARLRCLLLSAEILCYVRSATGSKGPWQKGTPREQ